MEREKEGGRERESEKGGGRKRGREIFEEEPFVALYADQVRVF